MAENKQPLLPNAVEPDAPAEDAGAKLQDSAQVKSSESILTKVLSCAFGNLAKNPKFILALAISFYITVFFIPVCSPWAHDYFFPPDCATELAKAGDEVPAFCKGVKELSNVNKARLWNTTELGLEYYDDADWEGFNMPEWAGYNVEGYWPNVVQLMFFTVVQSSTGSATGGTANAAVQGMVGTIAANMNVGFMAKIFPVGGKCKEMLAPDGTVINIAATANKEYWGLRMFCEEYEDPNFDKYFWFIWVDFFLFMFLVLACNCEEGVMKFGLSWHMFYMMGFISNAGYIKSHAVMVTSSLGVTLAVLSTLTPAKVVGGDYDGKITFNNLATNNLPKYTESACERIEKACNTAVDYMVAVTDQSCMKCRQNAKLMSQRFTVEKCVDDVPGIIANLNLDYKDAWYERFVFFLLCRPAEFEDKYGDSALFLNAFSDHIGGFDDALRLLKKAVIGDGELGLKNKQDVMNHAHDERNELSAKMKTLTQANVALLRLLTKEGKTDDADLKASSDEVKKNIIIVRAAYNKLATREGVPNSTTMRNLRSNLSLYVFSFLCLGHKALQMADASKEEAKDGRSVQERGWQFISWIFKTWCSETKQVGCGTFEAHGSRWKLFGRLFEDKDKRMFAFRNWLSIGIVFLMGDYLFGNVFQPAFNPAMAGTLAVLISHFPGSAFYKNLMRLLGITLGKVLPIIVMAMVSTVGAHGGAVTYVHLFFVFVYEAFFALMYYTSPEWSYVGCLCAGFGCYGLVGVNVNTWSADAFGAHYEELGCVVAAIMVQIVIDTADTAWRKKFPRDVVVDNLKVMVYGNEKEGPEEKLGLIAAYKMIEQVNWEKVKEVLTDVKTLLADQEAMLDECKDKTQIIGGSRPQFKHGLYSNCCDHISNLVSELEALCLVNEYIETLDSLDMENVQHADVNIDHHLIKDFTWIDVFKVVPVDDFAEPIKIALESFHDAMSNDKTEIEVKLPKNSKGKLELDVTEIEAKGAGSDVAKARNMGMLFDVVSKLLPEARAHALKIEHELYTNGINITFKDEV